MARAPKQLLSDLDIEQVEYLSVRGVPQREIAAFIGCHANTIGTYCDREARERYRERLFERCREERHAT